MEGLMYQAETWYRSIIKSSIDAIIGKDLKGQIAILKANQHQLDSFFSGYVVFHLRLKPVSVKLKTDEVVFIF